MSEVLSEMGSVSVVEKNVLNNQNSDEMAAAGLGDDHDVNGDGVNTFLAVQEIQAPPSPEKINVSNEVVPPKVVVKPKIMVTTEVRPRLRWTHELHEYFLQAVNQLGGPRKATPKAVQDLMDLDGLSLYQIKSHLQKFRLGKFSAKEWQDTAKNVTELVGGSWNSVPRRINEFYCRRQRVKKFKKNRKESQEQFHLRVEAEKHLQMLMEAQRMGLLSALNCESSSSRGREVATSQDLRNEDLETAILHRQAWANNHLANYRTMAGAHDLGTMSREPQFYPNQQNTFPTHDTLTTQANLGNIQEIPFSYQLQTTLYPAPRDLSTSFGGYGSYPASLYQETFAPPTGSETSSYQGTFPTPTGSEKNSYQGTFPTPTGSGTSSFHQTFGFPTPTGSGTSLYHETFPKPTPTRTSTSTGSGSEEWLGDEDSIELESFLNWDDNEPKNLDFWL